MRLIKLKLASGGETPPPCALLGITRESGDPAGQYGDDATSDWTEKSMKPQRICFYGNFGAGNLGNEATLQAVIEQVLRLLARWATALFLHEPTGCSHAPPHRSSSVASSQSNRRGEFRRKGAPGQPGSVLAYCFPADSSRTGPLDQMPARAQPRRYAHCRRDRNCL